MATILGVSHLFSEARDKHGVWIIVSMSGFEILFESQVNMAAYYHLRWELLF